MKAIARQEEISTTPNSEVALSDLTIDQLEALVPAAEARIKEIREQERLRALAKLDEVATSLGLSKADLARHYGKSRKKTSRAAPKYRNPANLSETWTGNGRRPAWVEEHLRQGGSLEAVLIGTSDNV